jgi:hypothetical protein
MKYAIKVIDEDGNEQWLCDGLGNVVAKFPSRSAAQRQVEFMKIGMEGDVQSINVVRYPVSAR